MRICFISMEAYATLRPGVAQIAGGSGFQLVGIARELRERGYSISFITGDFGQAFREDISGMAIYRANRSSTGRSYWRSLVNIGRLARSMYAARADVYILRSTRFLAGQCWLMARALRSRYGFMVANMSNCEAGQREGTPAILNRLYAASLRRADLVSAQTRVQQRLLSEEFGIETVLIPNGIVADAGYRQPTTPEFDILWVGSIKPVKRPEVLLDIVRLLPQRTFAVVGGPGDDQDYSERMVAALSAATNVSYLGFVPPDEVEHMYRRARMLLNTSEREGFPNTYLYAWAHGVPTCTLNADPDGAIQKNGLGLVATDPFSLAADIDRLLANEPAYREAAQACRAFVVREHSLSKTADALIAALRRIGLSL